jgi:Holliday junction resolvase RusA-like endonuclease
MEKLITFTVEDIPPSLNTVFTMHWIKRRALQEYWNHLILSHWNDLGKPVFLNPVKLNYVLKFGTKRARDYDNYIGGTKFVTDALKRTFFFRDDAGWLRGINVEFNKGGNETDISIVPIEKDNTCLKR